MALQAVPAIDVVNEAPKSKRRRVNGCSMTDAQLAVFVSKMLYDNLRGLTPQEIDGNADLHGRTLRTVLMERKRMSLQSPMDYPIGKTFYKECRQTFSSAESPRKRVMLAAQALNESINVELLEKRMKYQATGQRAAVIGYVQMCERLGAHEFLCVCATWLGSFGRQLALRTA
jgi:hypothetical protein